MSRIRSVHPGFFTDENLVCASMAARLLFIGLGVEADDKGIFEWKPLTLKMRLFPADHVLVEELLAELVNVNAVRQYEIDGRKYGAIRNFRRHQKPKTPNSIHPITPEIGIYVALPASVSETDDDEQGQFPPKGEKPRLMEDGGGKGSSEAIASADVVVLDPEKIMFDAGVALITQAGKAESSARSWLARARRDYGSEAVIAAIGRAKREGALEPISFMETALRVAANARASPMVGSPC